MEMALMTAAAVQRFLGQRAASCSLFDVGLCRCERPLDVLAAALVLAEGFELLPQIGPALFRNRELGMTALPCRPAVHLRNELLACRVQTLEILSGSCQLLADVLDLGPQAGLASLGPGDGLIELA